MDGPDGDFIGEVRERHRTTDLLVLVGVPALLIALFALPRESRMALAFRQTDPTLWTAFASHYVHLTPDHLVANLLGYLTLAPLVYLLCLLSGYRRLFRAATVTFLLAFPVALSGLELVTGSRQVGLGFSGINGAFFGLLTFALARYARVRFAGRFDATDAPPAFFLGVAIIAVIAVPPTVRSVGVAAAAVLSALLYLESPFGGDRPTWTWCREVAGQAGYFELAGASLGLFLVYPFVAFPADAVTGAGIVNLYAHLLGFCMAFIVTYVASLVAEWDAGAEVARVRLDRGDTGEMRPTDDRI